MMTFTNKNSKNQYRDKKYGDKKGIPAYTTNFHIHFTEKEFFAFRKTKLEFTVKGLF